MRRRNGCGVHGKNVRPVHPSNPPPVSNPFGAATIYYESRAPPAAQHHDEYRHRRCHCQAHRRRFGNHRQLSANLAARVHTRVHIQSLLHGEQPTLALFAKPPYRYAIDSGSPVLDSHFLPCQSKGSFRPHFVDQAEPLVCFQPSLEALSASAPSIPRVRPHGAATGPLRLVYPTRELPPVCLLRWSWPRPFTSRRRSCLPLLSRCSSREVSDFHRLCSCTCCRTGACNPLLAGS
jgi:hypothetical protein